MGKPKMSHEEFVTRLKEVQPDIEVLGKYTGSNKTILVKTKYSLHNCTPSRLLSGSFPQVKSALNREDHATALAKEYFPDITVLKWRRHPYECLIDTKYGQCSSRLSTIVAGFRPKALSAVDKDLYTQLQLREAIGDQYDFTLVKYKDKSNIILNCPEHGKFSRPFATMLNECKGCNECKESVKLAPYYSRTGYIDMAKGRTCKLYIIKCFSSSELSFIKIGITVGKIEYRFSGNKLPYDYLILNTIKGSAGMIYDLEKILHRIHKPYRYTPSKPFAGATECFTHVDNRLLDRGKVSMDYVERLLLDYPPK